MVGWHHQFGGHESEQALGVGDRQCCSPWGHKESDMNERLNWTELNLITKIPSALSKWKCQLLSLLTLCNPMDFSPLGFFVHRIFQARILKWDAISFSRGSSRDWTWISCIAGRFFFTVWATLPPKATRFEYDQVGDLTFSMYFWKTHL